MTARVAPLQSAAIALLSVALLAGCASSPKPVATVEVGPAEPAPPGGDWRTIASEADRARLDGLAGLWNEALAAARAGGFARKLREEGDLLRPDAALAAPAPTPGSYRCRVVKVGGAPKRAFGAFPSFFCYVDADGALLTFVKQTGSQRPAGRMWAEGDRQLVFLGALPATEGDAPAYGDSPEQSVVGVVERIAPFRWRMVLPAADAPAQLDVLELTPVVEETAAG